MKLISINLKTYQRNSNKNFKIKKEYWKYDLKQLDWFKNNI